MCGIIGYIGNRNSSDVILGTLEIMQTRGYHGFGVAGRSPENVISVRKKGGEDCSEEFFQFMSKNPLPLSFEGIGHNRWATQGKPEDKNAHPHFSTDRSLLIVHNGIIENNEALVKEMQAHSFPVDFISETDTEILASWIAFIKKESKLSFKDALKVALKKVQGSYAIICMLPDEPGILYSGVCGGSLWIGIGNYLHQKEYFIASETPPFLSYTQDFVKVESNRIVVVSDSGYVVETFDGVSENPVVRRINAELDAAEKGDNPHWMLKEIKEQGEALRLVMQGRVSLGREIRVNGIFDFEDAFRSVSRLFVVAHGTSYYAARIFKYMLEEHTDMQVEVELASEFSSRKNSLRSGDIVIGVSQSGETKDTITALEYAEQKGAHVLGICNVEGSRIAEMTPAGIFLRAGREIGVASTKAFTAQLTVFAMLTIHIARLRGSISKTEYNVLESALLALPEYVKRTIESTESLTQKLAIKYSFATSMYYLGRGANYPIALEGALKLKEIAGIHAEGYSASEMKHGPIGLIGEHMPVVSILTDSSTFSKSLISLAEAKTRNAPVIAIVSEGSNLHEINADDYIIVPKVLEFFSPIINVIPLQLFAYHMALLKGKNPDKPAGLAKSVTVD